MESKRFLMVLVLSSAARMPLPGATMACATCSSVIVFVMGSSPLQYLPSPCCPWHSANATVSEGGSSLRLRLRSTEVTQTRVGWREIDATAHTGALDRR